MPALIDIQGQRFGRYLVLSLFPERKHGKAAWLCQCNCGKERIVSGDLLRSGSAKSCGCLRSELSRERLKKHVYLKGDQHPGWRGGRRTNKAGYVQVYAPNHPRADKHTGYVYEHILNYEKYHDLHIPKGWQVHHRNGVRHDNHPENLELWRNSHPSGQRPEDMLKELVNVLGKAKILELVNEISAV